MNTEQDALRLSAAGNLLFMVKVGRTLYVGAHVLVPKGLPLRGMEELDRIRAQVHGTLASLAPVVVSDVLFTADPATLNLD